MDILYLGRFLRRIRSGWARVDSWTILNHSREIVQLEVFVLDVDSWTLLNQTREVVQLSG